MVRYVLESSYLTEASLNSDIFGDSSPSTKLITYIDKVHMCIKLKIKHLFSCKTSNAFFQ